MYILLFVFWLILNAKITLEIVIVGLVLTSLIGVLIYILFDYTPKRELLILKKLPLFIVYVFVLIWEIIKANFTMIGFIFKAQKNIDPVLVTFDAGLKTNFGRFILANSITLTPGTITIDIKDDTFTVHCLKRSFLDISEDSVFIKWAKRLEA